MDEHVLRAGDAHAGGLDAAAIVVVLEEPDAERLVQRPDPLVGGSRHGHAEEADRRDVEEGAGMLARMPRRGRRSEERRAGKGWVRTCRSRWSTSKQKKKQ